MENINWKEIRNWLDDRAECDYEFSDIDCHARPNKEMRALTVYEAWQQNLWGTTEEEVINEVLEILEELPDREDYNSLIFSLNRRYFEIMNAKEEKRDKATN
jgi:hypothetical protein